LPGSIIPKKKSLSVAPYEDHGYQLPPASQAAIEEQLDTGHVADLIGGADMSQGEAASDDEAESRERKARANFMRETFFPQQNNRTGRLWIGFLTAWEGLINRANVHAGQKVLVLGGSGGVGPHCGSDPLDLFVV
jgi:hypothetical protein